MVRAVTVRQTMRVVPSLLIASAALVASGSIHAAARTQRGDPITINFVVTSSTTSWTKIPGHPEARGGEGYPGEDYPLAYCDWPSDMATISVADAKTFRCSPYSVGLAVPAPGSFEIISSTIGDKWPETQSGGLSRELRFVKRDGDVLEVGPTLMEYGDYSGGARPSFDESDGSLWIFDDKTEHGPQVIRISTESGKLLQRTTMPQISRPVIGANALGFWLAQDTSSLYPSSGVRLGIWFAPIDASKGELVKATRGSAWAMVAHGDAIDVFISPRLPVDKSGVDLWRFSPAK